MRLLRFTLLLTLYAGAACGGASACLRLPLLSGEAASRSGVYEP